MSAVFQIQLLQIRQQRYTCEIVVAHSKTQTHVELPQRLDPCNMGKPVLVQLVSRHDQLLQLWQSSNASERSIVELYTLRDVEGSQFMQRGEVGESKTKELFATTQLQFL